MQHLLQRIGTAIHEYENIHGPELSVAELRGHSRVLEVLRIALGKTDFFNCLQLLRDYEALEGKMSSMELDFKRRVRELQDQNNKLKQRERNHYVAQSNLRESYNTILRQLEAAEALLQKQNA